MINQTTTLPGGGIGTIGSDDHKQSLLKTDKINYILMVRYQKFAENVQQLFGDCQKWFEIVDHDQVDGLCNVTKRLLDSFQKCEQIAQRVRHVGFEYPDECPEYSVTFQCSRIWNEHERSFPTQLTTSRMFIAIDYAISSSFQPSGGFDARNDKPLDKFTSGFICFGN